MAEHLTKESSLEKIKAHVFFLKSINKGLMDSYWADKLFEFSGNFILPNVVAEAMGANWDQTYRWSPDKPNDIIKSDMIFDDDIEMTSEEIKLFLVSLQIFTATIVDTILDPVDQQRYWKDVRGVEKEPISSEGVI